MQTTIGLQHTTQLKRAELLSSVGAGVLGAGIALLLADVLSPYTGAILLAGLLAHAWGMFQKHQLERQRLVARVGWIESLYWLCWLILAGLLLVIILRQL
jgi:uncharacterized membrane protein